MAAFSPRPPDRLCIGITGQCPLSRLSSRCRLGPLRPRRHHSLRSRRLHTADPRWAGGRGAGSQSEPSARRPSRWDRLQKSPSGGPEEAAVRWRAPPTRDVIHSQLTTTMTSQGVSHAAPAARHDSSARHGASRPKRYRPRAAAKVGVTASGPRLDCGRVVQVRAGWERVATRQSPARYVLIPARRPLLGWPAGSWEVAILARGGGGGGGGRVCGAVR